MLTRPELPEGEGADEQDAAARERDDAALLDRLAKRVVELRMAPAAIFFLETSKPVSFIASQGMIVLEPAVQSVFQFAEYARVQRMMEDRDNIERLIRRIEDLEDARVLAERDERRSLRQRAARRKRLLKRLRGRNKAPRGGSGPSPGEAPEA
jgi:hypothetical protein